ncbi:phage tail protein [Yersinia pseudotuberculosis]|uniref:phage tail protein n=1 Tax=Yersinia pseudotuberculosis TaxID=633 RepID=UPI0005DC9BCF|nr:phage tail protein [Yersinia pseudotuberculosis]PSH36699.1 phage tail protein [Yersinia pseudotuberculosis]CND38037.1 minor tail fiber protein M [Yersinia pseudotuberculosis]CQH06552.1 minor tail fiber protein M [Yersinia pseudotuberculosis]
MPETFTWSPQKGFTASRAPNVAVVKLGDGYEQRQVKGINPLMDSYSLTFMGTDGQCNTPNIAKQAEAFIKARMAVESFYWTPSDTGVLALYVCRSWSMKKTGPVFELSCTFEQVPR